MGSSCSNTKVKTPKKSIDKTEEENIYKLPYIGFPTQYIVDLTINSFELKYNGEIEIDITIDKETNSIYLNKTKSFSILKCTGSRFDKISDFWSPLELISCNEGIYAQSIKIEFKDKLVLNDVVKLKFSIEGDININNFAAFYVSLEIVKENETLDNINSLSKEEFIKKWKSEYPEILNRSSFVTVSEPVETRHIFPSFDEPSYKALFKLSLSIDEDFFLNNKLEEKLQVLSNASLSNISELDILNKKYRKYQFKNSTLMPTYLLTWVIGYFDYIESKHENIPIKIFTPVDKQHLGTLAMETTIKSLRFYEKVFKIDYKLSDKIYLVPVTNNSYRALENTGCIVFKNSALLSDKTQDIEDKKKLCKTVVHEICHMWFGNLVTMKWWNDLWLNEGFARFMEYLCINSIKPDYSILDDYILQILFSALEYDQKETTHPVRSQITNPDKISEIFDTISYAKGSAVIRMIYYWIGEEEFWKSLNKYLTTYSHKNADCKDLFDCFESKFDLHQNLKNWLDIEGYPLVTVDIEGSNIVLTQNINLLDKSKDENENIYKWNIPLFIKTKSIETIYLMKNKKEIIPLEKFNLNSQALQTSEDFLIVNSDIKGFYRVKYPNFLITAILANYNRNESPNNKINSNESKIVNDKDIACILNDHTDKNNINIILRALDICRFENSYIILKVILDKLNKHYDKLITSKFFFSEYPEIVNQNPQNFNPTRLNELKETINSNYNLMTSHHNIILSKQLNYIDFDYLKKRIYSEGDGLYFGYSDNKDMLLEVYLRLLFLVNTRLNPKKELNKDQYELLEYIITNFNLNHVNRNLKYVLIEIYLRFKVDLTTSSSPNDTKHLDNVFKDVVKNYLENKNFISVSTEIVHQKAFFQFSNLSMSTIEWYYDNYINTDFGNIRVTNFFKSFNTKSLLDFFRYKASVLKEIDECDITRKSKF